MTRAALPRTPTTRLPPRWTVSERNWLSCARCWTRFAKNWNGRIGIRPTASQSPPGIGESRVSHLIRARLIGPSV